MGEGCIPKTRTCCSRSLLPARWTLALVGLVGFTFVYSLRINMSMAIVCMVNTTTAGRTDNNTDSTTASPPNQGYEGEFHWSKDLQGHILGSFFYGYMVTQVIGGWLADRYGGKHVYGCGMAITILCTMILPVCARRSVYLVIALRVIMGMGTGVTFPAMNSFWAAWAPPLERSRLITLCTSGTTIGNILTLALSGLLCSSGVDGGWPLIFYVFGGGAVIWFISWQLFVYNSPAEHPCMKDEERQFLAEATATLAKPEQLAVPWLSMLTSLPLWAILVAHTCNNWGGYMLLTSLPKYMNEVLKYDIKSNGVLSAMPYMVQLVAAISGGQLADCLQQRNILSTQATRKVLQIISFIGQGAFMVGTGFVSESQRGVAVALLAIAVGFTFGSRAGYMVNHVDIAPRYAGILFGITNTAASVPGIIAPLVVAKLTPNGLREEWQKVFYITGAVFAFGAIFFGIFAKGDEQEWARDKTQDERVTDVIQESGKSGYQGNEGFQMDQYKEGTQLGTQIDYTHNPSTKL